MRLPFVSKYLSSKNERSSRALINIIFSFFLKGISVLVQILLVPLTIDYLDKFQYGIWLTLASIFGWFSFFDIGIGNGLRNKLSEAFAKKDFTLAKVYISTAYAYVGLIFLLVIVLFFAINPFLNWGSILNIPIGLNVGLEKLTYYVFLFFALRFIFGLIGNVLFADQKPALNNAIGPVGDLLALLIIIVIKGIVPGSLFLVGVIYSGIPLLVFLIFNIVLFNTRYKLVAPSFKYVKVEYLHSLLGLGLQFFVIQLAAIILFTTSNILLTQFFGPEEVTSYNVAFKYFAAISMIYGIIINPFWSAITEAYVKNDLTWIRSVMKKLDIISSICVAVCIIFYLIADKIYLLWVGESVIVPKMVSFAMALFVIVGLLGAPASTFINGTGKIRLQLYSAILTIILTVPLAYLFCIILDIGPSGVIFAMLCTTLPTTILWRVQYSKIIKMKAKGIWNK